MSHNRSSQKTRFVESIRTGDLEGVQNILRLWTGNLDKSNPRLKEWLKERLNDHKETALHIAVKHQQESIVKWLLQYEADICVTDLYLRTVLHTACDENEGINIISLILKYESVDVNAKEQNGITPVWLAAEKGNSSAVKLLMDNGADITIADKQDNTSLHVAAKTGNPDVLELLLAKLVTGSNKGIIGKQNKDKDTPLHLAVTSKNRDCVAMLLNAGAAFTMHIENEQGQTATDLAKEHGNKRIISLLEDPQKAKELFQAKPKPKPVLGRFASVEPDSAANHTSNPVSPTGASELLPVPQNTGPVQFIAKNVIVHQQFNTNVSGGCVAVGTSAQVVTTQGATAIGPPRYVPSGDSHYNVNNTGGNAAVGDNAVINLAPGTPGSTPSTAGSSNGPFFPEPQENSDTSSGFPTEIPSSLRATESATRPTEEHSPGDKLDESARRPVQEAEESTGCKLNESARHPVKEAEESPGNKLNESARHPVQEAEGSPGNKLNESARHPVQEAEESPGNKLNESARHPVQEAEESPGNKLNESARHPVQEAEESPGNKLNESARHPVQEAEESPGNKLNESARRPVQEGHPRDPSDVSTLSCPVQEECPTDKSHVSSTSPVQEESPKDEFKESLHHPVQEEHPSASLSRPVQEECPADKSHISSTSPVQEESPMGKWNASLPYAVPEERSPRKLDGAVNGSHSEEVCASRDSISNHARTDDDLSLASDYRFTGEAQLGSSFNGEPGVERMGPAKHTDAKHMNPGSCDKAGALKGMLFDGEASKQNWQETMKDSAPRRDSPRTRGVPKVAQDQLLNEASKSHTNETFNLDQLGDSLESQLNSSGPHNGPVAGARFGSSSSSTCAPSLSGSKESPHRKAQHSRVEPESLHGTLPTGAGANESMTTARNGQASFPGNHYGDNREGTSRGNLSSGTNSSADGPCTAIEDDNPDDDLKGHKRCDDGCRLM